ncbi:MAG: Digeranylgeranylglycerophospholipid reductase [Euryarchaeota archaeon ADurb.BinA087]|nr:MAG: Digeranylgeranylglycerophospholipid reductase [Euryarchaeota archaeon ADurb.BinA087]
MSNIYDVIVVGAGPSGAMAAKICAEKGLNVIIIDKQSFPRDKPCGGGVSKKALDLINENLPPSIIENYVYGFRLYSKNFDCIELKSKEFVGITTDRSKFDSFLVDLAIKKGAKFLQNGKVVNIEFSDNNAICKLKNGDEIEGKIIIGADGAHGIVARKTNIRQNWKLDEIGIGIEATISLENNSLNSFHKNYLELYFLDIPHGYGWVFPKSESISIGVGYRYDRTIKPRDLFKKFCERISDYKSITFSADEFKVHIIPAGGFKRNITNNRVLLVGDAAGFIDPLTGEGIYYALKSGKIAAQTCYNAIQNGIFTEQYFYNSYQKKCENEFNKSFRKAIKISSIFYRNTTLFLNFLKNYSGEGWSDFATGKRNYEAISFRFIPDYFLKKLL